MMNNIRNDESGLSGVDVVISIGVIIVFVSIVAVIYINLHMINLGIERNQRATNYAIEILEKVDELYYSEVNSDNFKTNDIGNGKHSIANIEIARGYNAIVTIENYNQTNGIDNGKADVVKTVNVGIEYKIGSKTEKVELKRIKLKENLVTPNKPKLNSDMVPVKYIVTNSEKVLTKTSAQDSEWYKYENKKWALAINKTDLLENGNIRNNPVIYAWIPRFAYYQTASDVDIKFIYANGSRYVNSNGDLETVTNSYNIPSEFENQDSVVDGIWINVNDIKTNNASKILSNSTKYAPINI